MSVYNTSYSKRLFNFALAIPIINSIATLTVNYFDAGSLNPGTVRAAIIGVFIFIFLVSHYQRTRLNNSIVLYLLLLLLLALLSSNTVFALYNYLKMVIALLMYPIGIYFFKSFNELLRLNSIIIIGLSFYIANLIISNIFQIGTSDYLENSVYFGSGRVNIAKSAALMLITTPIYFQYYKPNRKFYYYLSIFIAFGGLLLVLISVKRSAILALAIGGLIYFVLNPKRIRSIKYLLVIGAFGLITSSLYKEQIMARFQAREERFEFTDPEFQEGENRIREFDMVMEDMKKRSPLNVLFGKEFFNDREYYNTRRMLHTDYMILLHGTGIIGFTWFYLIYILVFLKINMYAKKIKEDWSKSLKIISIALIAGSMALSIAGSIYTVDILSLLFLYTGAITGVLKTQYNQIRTRQVPQGFNIIN